MTAEPAIYHPVSLDHEYLAGKLLEKYAGAHAGPWESFSAERREQVREVFLAATVSLQESLATGSPAFLIDNACREQARSAHRHLPKGFVISCLGVLADVLPRELPADYREQAGAWVRQAARALKTSPGCTDTGAPLTPAAQSLLDAVLAADQERATAIVDTALAGGATVRDIYLTLFQPLLKETGQRWEDGRAGISDEHYVTAFVSRNMARLHDRIAAEGRTVRRGKTVVAACVGEELHDIGIRMVADFFEMDGWDVYYTGANTPARCVPDTVKARKASAVALSVTMPSRLPALQYLIRSLRADAATAGVKIIVGGYPFSILAGLWKQVGADAGAATAEEAVAAANRLTTGSR
jgi:methanogenic corrinoid protein MtbC1